MQVQFSSETSLEFELKCNELEHVLVHFGRNGWIIENWYE